MRKQKGFSLIELLIVVAIILIIAAIAIPSLMRSKATANEAGGAATTRTLITDSISYSNSFPAEGYPLTLTRLGAVAQPCVPSTLGACLADTVLACAAPPWPWPSRRFLPTRRSFGKSAARSPPTACATASTSA